MTTLSLSPNNNEMLRNNAPALYRSDSFVFFFIQEFFRKEKSESSSSKNLSKHFGTKKKKAKNRLKKINETKY